MAKKKTAPPKKRKTGPMAPKAGTGSHSRYEEGGKLVKKKSV